MIAFVFSGQGSQHPRMGKELLQYDCFSNAVNDASHALGYSVMERIENKTELDKTEHTQPIMLTMGFGCLRVLSEHGIKADYVAGLSLGEYTAYVASGAMDFLDGVKLLQKRGQYMAEAVPSGTAGMCAVIGLGRDDVEQTIESLNELGFIAVANYNCPGQTVIAGENNVLDVATELFKIKGAKCIRLNVSGPFHTMLLKNASDQLAVELNKIKLNPLQIPVITNLTGEVVTNSDDIQEILIKQMISPVRWEESIRTMIAKGVTTFIELGAGKTLCSFIKQIDRNVQILNVEDNQSLEQCIGALKR